MRRVARAAYRAHARQLRTHPAAFSINNVAGRAAAGLVNSLSFCRITLGHFGIRCASQRSQVPYDLSRLIHAQRSEPVHPRTGNAEANNCADLGIAQSLGRTLQVRAIAPAAVESVAIRASRFIQTPCPRQYRLARFLRQRGVVSRGICALAASANTKNASAAAHNGAIVLMQPPTREMPSTRCELLHRNSGCQALGRAFALNLAVKLRAFVDRVCQEPPASCSGTSSVITVNCRRFAMPNDVVSATSDASRPTAISTRPTRGRL